VNAIIDFTGIHQRHNIVAFFEGRGIRLRKCGSYFVGRCPFHDEQNGTALIVYPRRQRWECKGKCQARGDIIDAAVRLDGLTIAEAARKLEGLPVIEPFAYPSRRETEDRQAFDRRLELPKLSVPTLSELRQLSEGRGIRVQALRMAAGRRFLWTYEDAREGRAWLITDRARRLAIARRLDGKAWEYRNGELVINPNERSKTKNLYGSQGNWPIGILESEPFPALALIEGAPDLISVFDHALAAGVQHLVAPICLSGASQRIPDSALPYVAGKRVRIFAHDDESGYKAAARWKEQLTGTASLVDIFEFSGLIRVDGNPVSDLNDLLKIAPSSAEQNRENLETLMDFARGPEGAVC
jgi:CHC2 zinc finger